MVWESPVVASTVPVTTPSSNLVDNKKLRPRKKKAKVEVMNKKTESSLIVSSSQVSTEGKDAEKLHWEPPWGQTELQE